MRLAALLVFIVLPLALVVMGAFNAVRIVDVRALAMATEEQSARLAERSAAAGAAVAGSQDLSTVFVQAASRSLAEAELQRQIITIIEGAMARVIESGAAEVPESEGDAIEMRATLDTDNDGLLRLLHAIETGLPLLSVEDLAVRRLQSDASGNAGEPELRIDLRVRGHWRSPSP